MKTKQPLTPLTKAHIRASAITELAYRGYNVWRNNNIAVRGRTFIGRLGVSDLIGITKDGRWVACEIKTLSDRLSKDQIDFLNDIKNAGGEAFIATQEGTRVVIKKWEVK